MQIVLKEPQEIRIYEQEEMTRMRKLQLQRDGFDIEEHLVTNLFYAWR